jgi:hypothetical protein
MKSAGVRHVTAKARSGASKCVPDPIRSFTEAEISDRLRHLRNRQREIEQEIHALETELESRNAATQQ